MLNVRGLHKRFEGERVKRALQGVSFKALPGTHTFIIGETGSGKSTLLKCIYGLYDLDKGTIKWKKLPVPGPSDKLIAGHEDMRLVEQEYQLGAFKTIEQNLEEALPIGLYKKEQKARVAEMIELFELKGLGKRKPEEISGGQQQRAAIAKAFINLPNVLLLDEPFAHFDPQMRNKIFEFLKDKMIGEETTILTVTHDYNETLKNADQVIVLNKGKVVQIGSPEDLYHQPANLYVAGLLGEYNVLTSKKKKLFVRPEEIEISKKGSFEGMVINNRFCGHFQEITIEHKGEEIVSFIPIGTTFMSGEKVSFGVPIDLPQVLENGEIIR